MGQYFQVNGDYNIKAKDGGNIVLDAGNSGNVNVVGNLNVSGDVTNINSSNLEIEDTILVLNKDDAGPGVTPRSGNTYGYAGIEIDRGTYLDSTFVPRAAFVWNERDPGFATDEDPTAGSGYWMIATGTADGTTATYGFQDSNLKLKRILTDSSTDFGDLTLIGTGTGVVKVKGTDNYRLQVTDPDDIPNKDYVDYSILNNPTFQIRAPNEDSRIIIADRQIQAPGGSPLTPGSLDFFAAQTGKVAGDESKIAFLVDNTITAQFYSNRVVLQSLEINDTEITNDDTNTNIFIRTNGTGKLQTNYAFQLDNPGVSPASVSGSHIVYSGTESTGDTGLYFATVNNRDELISKSRALVWSIIF